jgi:hypothetical protein
METRLKEALRSLESKNPEFENLKGIRKTLYENLDSLDGNELSRLAIEMDILLGSVGEVEAELAVLYLEASDTRKIKFNHYKCLSSGNEDNRIKVAFQETVKEKESEYILKYLYGIVKNRREVYSGLSTKLQTRINVLRNEFINSQRQ